VVLNKVGFSSLRRLEFLLGSRREELYALADVAGAEYHPFYQLKKTRPFQRMPSSAKRRKIDNPTERLKRIQRRINDRLLKPLVLPQHMRGGIPGRDVSSNVAMHFGANTLVKLDIRSFFPSISNLQVYNVWRTLLGFSAEIASLLTRLTTFERHLPQGAPTSTLLANLALYNVDEAVRNACVQGRVVYSTWVDDLALSGASARNIIDVAVVALRDGGFAVPHRKLIVQGAGDRKILNGTLMGRIPTVPREYFSRIRSGIHKLASGQVARADRAKYLCSLEGQIKYVAKLDSAKGGRLLAALQGAEKRFED
jgi:RNA-directed DNA polymerase